jgi:hypothetical protein
MSLQATRRKVISDLKNYIDLQEAGIAFTGDNQPYPKPVNKPWIHAAFIPGRRFRTNIGTVTQVASDGNLQRERDGPGRHRVRPRLAAC